MKLETRINNLEKVLGQEEDQILVCSCGRVDGAHDKTCPLYGVDLDAQGVMVVGLGVDLSKI